MRRLIMFLKVSLFGLLLFTGNQLYAQCTDAGIYMAGSTVTFGVPVDRFKGKTFWSTPGGEITGTSTDGAVVHIVYANSGYYTVGADYSLNLEPQTACWEFVVVANLAGGTIGANNVSTLMGEVFEYSQVKSLSPATGGMGVYSGRYTYSYQWEESTDSVIWLDIAGATGVNCAGSDLVTGKKYFRRRVSDYYQTAYSNVFSFTPATRLTPGQISASQTIKPGSSPVPFSGNAATGGNGTYVYQWESSTDGMKWTTISGATATGYQAPAMDKTTYYRRKCSADKQSGYSNSVQLLVADPDKINTPAANASTGTSAKVPIPDYSALRSDTFNKVATYAVMKPGVTTPAALLTLNNTRDFQKTISYRDGLNRQVENVILNAGTDNKDLIGVNAYDEFGRMPVQHLSYLAATDNNNVGSFRSDAATKQPEFYNTITNNQEDYFYGKLEEEAAPESRYALRLAPGKSFVGSGISRSSTSRFNLASDAVRLWTVGSNDNDLPVSTSLYAAGTLHVNIVTNEHGQKQYSYYDRQGRLIMSTVQVGADAAAGELRTYYVYGEVGDVRYVLSPMAVKYCDTNNSWDFSGATAKTILDELCYKYLYDEKGRVTSLKQPGIAASTAYVYDSRGRCVFLQNALLKDRGEWLLTFYDGLDRQTMSASYKNAAATRESLQSLVNQSTATNSIITFSNPPAINLYLDKRGTQSTYEATQSVVLLDGFETSINDELIIQANPNAAPAIESITVQNPVPSVSGYVPLVVYYYDNYQGQGLKAFDNSYTLDAGANLYADPTAVSNNTQGRLTGVKQKVMGREQWMTYTYYYDAKGRIIQSLIDNISGGTDVTTQQYDFNSNLLSSHELHKNPQSTGTPVLRLLNTYQFDAKGNMTQVAQRIINNGTGTAKLLSAMTYDNMGRLRTKQLSDLETLNYTYALNNKLKGINSNYAKDKSAGNYFGLEISFDNGFSTKDLTGNISGVTWRRKGNPDEWHAYGYTYDNSNRLSKADYSQSTSGNWNNGATDYSTTISQYDDNGNIKKMKQQGMLPGNAKTTIDDLTYNNKNNEWSNQLRGVTDALGDKHLGDFHNYQGRTGIDDYTYDIAGNLIKDKNKGITITNNYLSGKPEIIKVDGTDKSVEYLYDVAGNTLQKVIKDGGNTVTYAYLNGAVYKDNELLYIPQPEGRLRRSANGTLVYDYFIADHLGNVRTVITDETSQLYYKATHEDNPQPAPVVPERELFSFPKNVDIIPVGHKFYDYNGTNRKFVKLNSNDPERKIGTGKVIRVMAGDKVEVGVMSYYQQNSPSNNTPNQIPADIVQQLINTLLGPAGVVANGKNNLVQSNANGTILNKDDFNNFVTNTQNQNPPSTVPKAYLNYVLFDESFKLVNGSALRVQTPDAVTPLAGQMDIPKNGFMYVYVSNESPTDVFFDDLVVKHTTGHLLQEDSYYPYGLQIAGLSSKALNRLENRELFNGIEKVNEFDLELYDAFYRTLDPQVGRWWQQDPENQQYLSLSPYNVNVNNPVNYVDPLGNKGDDWFQRGKSLIWLNSTASQMNVAGEIFNNVGKNISVTLGQYTYQYIGEKLINVTENNLMKTGAGFAEKTSRFSFSVLGEQAKKDYERVVRYLRQRRITREEYHKVYRGKVLSGGLSDGGIGKLFGDIDLLDPLGTMDAIGDKAEEIGGKLAEGWNSPVARVIIPDYYTLHLTTQTSSGIFLGEDVNFTLLLRGRDPGLYVNSSTNGGGTLAVGQDWGLSIGRGTYLGPDVSRLNSSLFEGWSASVGGSATVKGGIGGSLGVSVDLGMDKGRPTLMTIKMGGSVGPGVSSPFNGTLGGSYSTPQKRIFSFGKK